MNFKISDLSPPLSVHDAIAIQKNLRAHLRTANDFGPLHVIAGIDVSYDISRNRTHAFIVLVDAQTLRVTASMTADAETNFPYVPGLLSFREIPAILRAFEKLGGAKPDLLMVDGAGTAHPRRLGIAAHLGLITDIPSIGVAKSRLVGTHAPLGHFKGATAALMDGTKRIGSVLRSKQGCNPLFVSPGHRIDQDTALSITMRCLTSYRLPEPTRLADKLSKDIEGATRPSKPRLL